MAKILVYAELNQGKLVPTTLELMAKARELGDVEAIALGAGAKAAAATLGKHGAKVVHVNEDPAFDDYLAEPATDALASLHKQSAADLILFGFTTDSREVAGRPLRAAIRSIPRSGSRARINTACGSPASATTIFIAQQVPYKR